MLSQKIVFQTCDWPCLLDRAPEREAPAGMRKSWLGCCTILIVCNKAESIEPFRIGIVSRVSHLRLLRNDYPVVRWDMYAVRECKRRHCLPGHTNYKNVSLKRIGMSLSGMQAIQIVTGFNRAVSLRKLSSRGSSVFWWLNCTSPDRKISSRRGRRYSGCLHKLYNAKDMSCWYIRLDCPKFHCEVSTIGIW